MSNQSDSSSLPTSVRRVAFSLRRAGWISFWVQLVLGVVSSIILLFAFAILLASQNPNQSNNSQGGGLFLALTGLLVLGFSIYRAFYHTRLSQQLRGPAPGRPSRGDTMKQMRISLISNMAGMLLTLMGAEAISGVLLAKAISQPQRGFFDASVNLQDFIQPLDIFIVLANTHTTVAHFVGIVCSIWLMEQIYKD